MICCAYLSECKFKETDTDKKVRDAHEHMDDLQKRMRKKLPAKNIYEYDIEWQEGVFFRYLENFILNNLVHCYIKIDICLWYNLTTFSLFEIFLYYIYCI